MATPKTPNIVKTVKKAFTGRQVPVSGSTVKPGVQMGTAPKGIKNVRFGNKLPVHSKAHTDASLKKL